MVIERLNKVGIVVAKDCVCLMTKNYSTVMGACEFNLDGIVYSQSLRVTVVTVNLTN